MTLTTDRFKYVRKVTMTRTYIQVYSSADAPRSLMENIPKIMAHDERVLKYGTKIHEVEVCDPDTRVVEDFRQLTETESFLLDGRKNGFPECDE
jgi:hypothetical protein